MNHPDSQDSSKEQWFGPRERTMSIGAGPAPPRAEAMQRREQKSAMLMTLVFFIINVSVILSYEWGAPTPEFRPDTPNILFLGILVAAIVYIAARYAAQA